MNCDHIANRIGDRNKSMTMKMKTIRSHNLLATAFLAVVAFTATVARAADPLPSWNDGLAQGFHDLAHG